MASQDLNIRVLFDKADKFVAPVQKGLAQAQKFKAEMNQAVQQSMADIRKMQSTLAGTKTLDGLRTKVSDTAKHVETLKTRHAEVLRLSQQDPTKNPAEFNAAIKELPKLQAELRLAHQEEAKLIARTEQVETHLKRAGVNTEQLSDEQVRLSKTIRKAEDALDAKGGELQQAQMRMERYQEALQTVQRSEKQLGQYNKLKQKMDEQSTAVYQAKQRYAQLQEKQVSGAKATARHAQSVEKARLKLERLTTGAEEQRQELKALEKQLEAAGVDTRNFGKAQAELERRMQSANADIDKQAKHLVKLADAERKAAQAAKEHDQARKNARLQFDKRMQGASNMMVTGAGTMYAGQRMLQRDSQPLNMAMDFDEMMSKVQALTRLDVKNSPEDAKKFTALRQQALDLGASTSFSASEAAGAQSFLAMSGFSPEKIMGAMPGMLSLAKAAGAELATTADISSNILSGFRLEADQMGRVGDVLTATFTRSNVDLSMLGEAMKYAAPVASELNVSLEETAAMAGLLGNVGIQASMAGTSMRAIFNRLSSPPKAAAAALEEIDVQTADSVGNMRSMPEILAEVAQKTEKMGNTQRMAIFKAVAGAEAGSAMATLVAQQGAKGITDFVDVLKDSAGEADRVAAIMGDNKKGRIKEIQSAWEGLMINLFGDTGALSPILDRLLSSTKGMLDGVAEWVNKNPELAGTLLQVAMAGGVLVAGLGMLGMAMAILRGPLAMLGYLLDLSKVRMGKVTGEGGRFIALLSRLASPLFGLVRLLSFVATSFTPMGLAVKALLLLLSPFLDQIVGLGRGLLYLGQGVFKQITAFVRSFTESFHQGLLPVLTTTGSAFSGLRDIVSGVIDWMKDKFGGFISSVFGVGHSLQNNSQAAEEWGRVLGAVFSKLAVVGAVFTAGLITLKVAMIGVRAVAFVGLLLSIAGGFSAATVKARLFTAAIWAGHAAAVAWRGAKFIGFLLALGGSFMAAAGTVVLFKVAALAASVGAWALGAAIAVLTSPITLIIAAVAALAAGVYFLYTRWDQVRAYLSDTTWGRVLLSVFDAVTNPVKTFTAALNWMQQKWRATKTGLQDTVWGTVLLAAFEAITMPIRLVMALFDGVFNGWESAKKSLSDTAWGKALLATIKIVSAAIQKLKDAWASAKGMVSDKFSGAVSWVKQKTGFGDGTPAIDGARASGGAVSPGGFYRVNELGPELLTMRGATYLMASHQGMVTPLISKMPAAMQAANDSVYTRYFPQTAGSSALAMAEAAEPVAPVRPNLHLVSSQAQPNTVTKTLSIGDIHIHAQPGMDAEQLADQVIQRIRSEFPEFEQGAELYDPAD